MQNTLALTPLRRHSSTLCSESSHVASSNASLGSTQKSRISNTASAQGLARFARFSNALLCAFAELRQQRVWVSRVPKQLRRLTGLARAKHSKMGSFSGRPADRPKKKMSVCYLSTLEASCVLLFQKKHPCLEVASRVWGQNS
jgi:hypothetical protein